MRLPYTFAVTGFGGRIWTVISALLLLIPASAMVLAVTCAPYWAVLSMPRPPDSAAATSPPR
jgi:NNP family nitrate/nitrite transporter-like MFS transporter